MKCKICGSSISETTTICPGCGALVDYNQSQSNYQEHAEVKKPFPIKIVIILLSVILIGGIAFLMIFLSPRNQFLNLSKQMLNTYIKDEEQKRTDDYYTSFLASNTVKHTGEGQVSYGFKDEIGNMNYVLQNTAINYSIAMNQIQQKGYLTLMAKQDGNTILNADVVSTSDKAYFKIAGINNDYISVPGTYESLYGKALTGTDKEYLSEKVVSAISKNITGKDIVKINDQITLLDKTHKVKRLTITIDNSRLYTIKLAIVEALKTDSKAMNLILKQMQSSEPTKEYELTDVINSLNEYSVLKEEESETITSLSIFIGGINKPLGFEYQIKKSGETEDSKTILYKQYKKDFSYQTKANDVNDITLNFKQTQDKTYNITGIKGLDQNIEGSCVLKPNDYTWKMTIDHNDTKSIYDYEKKNQIIAKNNEYETTVKFSMDTPNQVLTLKLANNAKVLKELPSFVIDNERKLSDITLEQQASLDASIKNLPVIKEWIKLKTNNFE